MSARRSVWSVHQVAARLASEGLSAHAWGNGPGDRYAAHAHGYDKVLVAAEGSIVFDLPDTGRSLELVPGDRLDLPADTAHGASVGPRGVTCLEAHLARGTLAGEPRLHEGWASTGPDVHAETVHERMA